MAGLVKRRVEADDSSGAPEWMVTFSDCMTLLLTFFVLLLSFSSFDEKTFKKLKSIFGGAMPSVSGVLGGSKDAFLPTQQILHTAELDKGSEKPTLVTGLEDRQKEETEPEDFRSRKVFLVPSKKVFWGKGAAISLEGRRTLSALAALLKEAPHRIVISENGLEADEGGGESGLERSWAVMSYLTGKGGLDKRWFSISASNTVPIEDVEPSKRGRPEAAGRVLEIVLLERSIYN
ncbi:MAG TPA: flagellar motor protein MotB [Sedimentisphaerales bacterium]|nr:flagellar motor protein MotB [Sedimentisphaerales bacterium]